MELRLDDCRQSCEVISEFDFRMDEPLSKSPQRLIGFGQYVDVFKGLIPLAEYDDGGAFSYLDDFSEIFPNSFPTNQRTGAAVMFTGETGCGKHTADYTFMSVAYQFVENEVIEAMQESGDYSYPEPSDLDAAMEFYRIDLSAYDEYAERRLSDSLDSLFDQIRKKAFSRPSVLCYFSLGDVTRVLQSKKLAQHFADMVERLTADSRARCILTCICNGKASGLLDAVKKPFYVLELVPPGKAARKEYFTFLYNSYPNILFGLSEDDLAALTDGFTFAEIKRLAAYMMMSVKAELKKRKLKISSFRLDSLQEQDKITLSEGKIRAFAALLSRSRYSPPAPAAPAFAGAPVAYVQQAAAQAPAGPAQQAAPAQEAPAAENGSPDKAGKVAEKVVESLDRPSDVKNVIDRLVIPSNFKTPVLMDHQTFYSTVFSVLMITVDDFLNWCAEKGLKNLSNLKSVTVSLGGHMILHPWDKTMLQPTEDGGSYDFMEVIREGQVLGDNVRRIGKDDAWLESQLVKNGCRTLQDVFLGACDESGELMVFRKK